jgi:mono/diheme cytochrome c family protein
LNARRDESSGRARSAIGGQRIDRPAAFDRSSASIARQPEKETPVKTKIALAFSAALAALAASAQAAGPAADIGTIARGKYVAMIGGCNDCHTPHYPESGGKVPETEWLTGAPVGFQGPWGTTYPANLRLLAQSMNETQWVARFRTEMRPPMPWFNLAAMTDADLQAVYRYVRSLGPKGKAVPQYVPPGQQVNTPYFVFVPQNLPPAPRAAAN